MKKVHVPDLIKTGLVSSYNIWKDTDAQHIYIFNYKFSTRQDLDLYQRDHAPALKKDVIDRYSDQFKASRRIFEQV